VDKIGSGTFQYRMMFVTGLVWAADALEVMMLSLIAHVLRCEWGVTDVGIASLTTVVFAGMGIGSPLFGVLGDRFGRKTSCLIGSAFLVFYGFLSAAAPNFKLLLILRFFVGLYVGSLPQAVVINNELTPSQYRAKGFLALCLAWNVGSIISILLSWATLPYFGWRVFAVASAIGPLVFLMMQWLLPESPLYLYSKRRNRDAESVLANIARVNKVELGEWRLKMQSTTMETSSTEISISGFRDLFSPELRLTSILISYLQFYGALSYYGVILLAPSIISGEACSSSSHADLGSCSANQCHTFTNVHYLELLGITMAEFLGVTAALLLSDSCGRKKMLAFLCLFVAGFTVGSGICASGNLFQVIVLFGARGFSAGNTELVILYVSEVYPTDLRSRGVGFSFFWFRLGAMVTPYLAQVLAFSSTMATVTVYGVLGLLAMVASLLLPRETVGRELE